MTRPALSRRDVLRSSLTVAGGLLMPNLARSTPTPPPSAVDRVPLGRTGLTLSRLGIGCGSKGGSVQRALGQEGFTRLLRYAYDRGITYIDTAEAYKTHPLIREAIRGLPRERLFIQSKMPGTPEDPAGRIETYLRELGTDYIDSLLVHCTVTPDWDERRKRVLDALEAAKTKGLIRVHGVSCHSLPALRRAVACDFVDVHLVRINPQGAHMDTPVQKWDAVSNATHVAPVVAEIHRMRAQGRGVIGMKLVGNGDFTDPTDRERAIRYVMQSGLTDAVTIGLKSTAEVDEAIERIDRALQLPVIVSSPGRTRVSPEQVPG